MIRSDHVNALAADLRDVTAETVRMLSMVKGSVERARDALIAGDLGAAEQCIEDDRIVDDLQERLERQILSIIARRQPAASDLRFLGAMHRALSDIERAGDYAVHVARAGARLASQPPLKKYLDMKRILDVESDMIEVTVSALTEGSEDAARRALAMDEEIDQLYDQIQRELLTYMIEDPSTITKATELLAVARYLERLGDHVENVCEHILFWLTGRRSC